MMGDVCALCGYKEEGWIGLFKLNYRIVIPCESCGFNYCFKCFERTPCMVSKFWHSESFDSIIWRGIRSKEKKAKMLAMGITDPDKPRQRKEERS